MKGICGLLLPEDFHLVLQAEAGLLGYTVKLGPHGVTHPRLAIDDITVSSAVDKRIIREWGLVGTPGSFMGPTGLPEPKMPWSGNCWSPTRLSVFTVSLLGIPLGGWENGWYPGLICESTVRHLPLEPSKGKGSEL